MIHHSVRTRKPEVTAIIVCMTDNEAPFAAAAIESALNQTVPVDVIVVVRDDNNWIGGVDLDRRVQIHRIPSGFCGRSRNAGAVLARTEFLAFLDGDDIWSPEKTEKQLEVAKATGAELIGADHLLVDEEGVPFAYALSRYIPMPSSWLIRRSTWEAKPFSDTVPSSEDGDWWRRYARSVKIVRLPEPLLLYRVREQSMSSARKSKRRKLFIKRLASRGLRPLIMMGSKSVSSLFRSTRYKWHPDWN